MTDFRDLLRRIDGYPSMYEHIDTPIGKLSIQASAYHYCTPRLTLDDPYKYTSFEVAIICQDGWLCPEHADWPEHVPSSAWCLGDDIAGYVAVHNVQAIYDALAQGG